MFFYATFKTKIEKKVKAVIQKCRKLKLNIYSYLLIRYISIHEYPITFSKHVAYKNWLH